MTAAQDYAAQDYAAQDYAALAEAVARAMCRSDGYSPDEIAQPGARPRWMGYDENATAALAAIPAAMALDADGMEDVAKDMAKVPSAFPTKGWAQCYGDTARLLRALAHAAGMP